MAVIEFLPWPKGLAMTLPGPFDWRAKTRASPVRLSPPFAAAVKGRFSSRVGSHCDNM